jgi:hypothetical protein
MMDKRICSIAVALVLASAIAATSMSGNFQLQAFAHQEHTDFITNAEFIKGHFEQAIANKQAGDLALAAAHAGHPIEEVFSLMKGPLEEVSQQRATDLEEALSALPGSVQSDTPEAFSQKITEINGLLDEAIAVYAGEEAEETATRAGVIIGLLETADVEYSEAVADGEIIEMIEYQDASAFINRASLVFDLIKTEINPEESEEISELFEQLDSSVGSNAAPANVKTLLDGIIHEMEEAVPSGDEHAEFVANLEFIRGHLTQALANKQAGEAALAAAHAGHPVEEVYSLIEGELGEADAALNTELEQALSSLAGNIDALSNEEVQTRVNALSELLDSARDAVVEEQTRSDPAFNSMVAILLLETADVEYSEAVADGEIIEMIEYQDASAFITRAQAKFNETEAELPEHEAQEIRVFFGQLDELVESNGNPDEVKTLIAGIIHEFEEAAGLESEGGSEEGNWAYVDRILELLDESVAAYQAGDAQEAKALAIEAYLENYEFIESDIAEDDRELMEKIEVDMRQELTAMIDEGRPAAEIESHVDTIKADLETARAIVTPEFPLVVAVAIAGIGALIAATRVTRIGRNIGL